VACSGPRKVSPLGKPDGPGTFSSEFPLPAKGIRQSASRRTPGMHVPAHHGPGKPLGGSGRLLQHGVSRPPGRMLAPMAGVVHEVCPGAARGTGRAVVDQVVRRDRFPGDLKEPRLGPLPEIVTVLDWAGRAPRSAQ
jgi:hypothetical protein